MSCTECANEDCIDQGKVMVVPRCRREMDSEDWLRHLVAKYEQRIAALEAANAEQARQIAELKAERDKAMSDAADISFDYLKIDTEVKALRAEREALEKQEPVAYRMVNTTYGHDAGFFGSIPAGWHETWEAIPLYSRPVPARTLTDAVMREIHSRLPITYTYDELMLATQAWLKGE